MDGEATSKIKTIFMSSWDGFLTNDSDRIVVLGATNRPEEIDAAIIRRMPLRLFVPLPDEADRAKILKTILRDEKHISNEFDYSKVARSTSNFSGSDLKEMCRSAVLEAYDVALNGINSLDTDATNEIGFN